MKYLGVALIVLGALMCITSEFFWPSMKIAPGNWYLLLAMLFIVAGICTHVYVSKRY